MFFMKPWNDNKFIIKSGMPISKNLLKLSPSIFYSYILHLMSWIENIDNQYRHNSRWRYKWHNLTLWKLSLLFYVLSHETLLMLKHQDYYFHNILSKSLCDCNRRIIHAFFYLLFEVFINIQCWINHISNWKLINTLLCIMGIKKVLRHMQYIYIMIKPQQWQHRKITTIIPFILVINFLFSFPSSKIFCLHVLTVLMTYMMNLIGDF